MFAESMMACAVLTDSAPDANRSVCQISTRPEYAGCVSQYEKRILSSWFWVMGVSEVQA